VDSTPIQGELTTQNLDELWIDHLAANLRATR